MGDDCLVVIFLHNYEVWLQIRICQHHKTFREVFRGVKDLANHGAITGVQYAVTHVFANFSYMLISAVLSSSEVQPERSTGPHQSSPS